MNDWDDEDFTSDDPIVRYNAHQAAKGRSGVGDPDEARKRAREVSTWSDEQRSNAMRYGVCLKCGAPREKEMLWTTTDDGEQICTLALVCGNGHEQ